MKFDLHMHTTRHSPDSAMDPFALVRQARTIGLDGVVITEHDWLWTESELEELRAAAPELTILAGIEVTAAEGHFLTYGVQNPFALPKGIGVADLCREVHRQGGAVVASHPFRWGQPFDTILREQKPELDGLELMTDHMDSECRQRAAEVFRQRRLAGLGSSDAHDEATLGVCYSEFEATIRTSQDLVNAIRSRRVVAREHIPAGAR
ncbi:MAG TPA: PHP domain-containing protein [Gemmataceae bacterium]|nr:PHP domain-containing protein [Gemmataceae bacterium]